MTRRPRIFSPCVADRHASPGERIAEFSFPDGSGGLISLRTRMDDGRNVIDVYRMDGVTLVAGSTVLDDGQRQAPAAGPTVRAGETRGSGPRWNHWPADLPFVHYITADGGRLCVTCANGGNGSRAADADIDPTCPDDRQWHVIGAQTEPEPHACDHCARLIPPSPTKGGPA